MFAWKLCVYVFVSCYLSWWFWVFVAVYDFVFGDLVRGVVFMFKLAIFFTDWDPMGFITICHQHLGVYLFIYVFFQASNKQIQETQLNYVFGSYS